MKTLLAPYHLISLGKILFMGPSPKKSLPMHQLLFKPARHTCFFNANLMHDVITGCSAMGLLHMLNQTPSAWTSTRQNQVETTTYGSEFMAACQAVKQTIDLHYTLCMFSVLLDGPSWILGDNQAVINSTMIPHASLSKCWNLWQPVFVVVLNICPARKTPVMC